MDRKQKTQNKFGLDSHCHTLTAVTTKADYFTKFKKMTTQHAITHAITRRLL